MKEKSNAAPVMAAPRRQEDERGQASNPCQYSTVQSPGFQGRIADILGVGERNAIPAKKLAVIAGCSSVRRLQAKIAAEVELTGALILCCPDGRGYFLAGSREELLRYEAALHKRALNTLRRLRAVRKKLKHIDGQMRMDKAN